MTNTTAHPTSTLDLLTGPRPEPTTAQLISRCEAMTEALSRRTGIAWTFGYIGNVSGIEGTPAYRDDRSWYAFAAHPGRVGTSSDRIGGESTANLARLSETLRGACALAHVLAERHAIVATPYGAPV